MKQKIKVTGVDGKVTEGYVNFRNPEHIEACIKYPSIIFEDKRKKDPKHKKKIFEEI